MIAMSMPDSFPPQPGFDDDIPEIDDSMIHHDIVDFEARMPVVPVVSIAIGLACVAAFMAEIAMKALTDIDELVRLGALESSHVFEGEYWRMLSCTFLHGGVDHILGNMMMLYVLGMACEHAFGRAQFLFLYVAAGIAGAAFSLMGGLPSVGASGAIFGLAGALIVLFARNRQRLHLRDRRIGGVLGFWAIYQLALGLFNPAVDNHAHLGGLIGGMAVGLILKPAIVEDRDAVNRSAGTRICLAAAILALIYCGIHFIPLLANA